MRKKTTGFSLIEIALVLVAISILAAIAIPTYTQQIARAQRNIVVASLSEAAVHMERYFAAHNTYNDATLENLGLTSSIADGAYTLEITNASQEAFTLSAVPEEDDPVCGTFTINQLSERGVSGTGTVNDCWQ